MKKKLFIVCSVILCSCSSKLTNEEALKILQENYISYCRGTIDSRIFKDDPILAKWKELEKEGLTKIRTRFYHELALDITNKGANEFGGNTKSNFRNGYAGKINFLKSRVIKVNGISQKDNNSANINFTISFEETPFYKLKTGNHCNKDSELEKTIELIKYDTGWKIKK